MAAVATATTVVAVSLIFSSVFTITSPFFNHQIVIKIITQALRICDNKVLNRSFLRFTAFDKADFIIFAAV
jgi:hypothetical protein